MSNLPSHPAGFQSWIALRRYTPAQIAIGRAGCGLPLKAHLEFQAAHARARDAVLADLRVDAFVAALAAFGPPVCKVQSAAPNRQVFLRQPNFGRLLSTESKIELSEPMVAPDIVIVIGDGLSSMAVERNAIPVLKSLWPRLQNLGYQLGPIVVATQARVALADQIGELLQAKLSIMMIGERPGLSAADSLGLYLTYEPRVGRVDSERNCISNVRDDGLNAEMAAAQALNLIKSMFAHRASGVLLSAAGFDRERCIFGRFDLSNPPAISAASQCGIGSQSDTVMYAANVMLVRDAFAHLRSDNKSEMTAKIVGYLSAQGEAHSFIARLGRGNAIASRSRRNRIPSGQWEAITVRQ